MAQTKQLEIVQPEGIQDDESCLTFVMNGEDHTLGNSLRYIIMKNPDTQFCGYNIPHPSENKINLRIQTHGQSAKDIYKIGLSDLSSVCEHIQNKFTEAVQIYKTHKEERSKDTRGDEHSESSADESIEGDEAMEED